MDSAVMLGASRSNKSRVLVIRLDAIGDFILWLDAAKDIRKLYPQGQFELVLLGNEVWTSLAESLPYFDKVWSLNILRFVNSPVYRFKILRKVRQTGFDIVIQPTFSRVFSIGDAIARISGAKEKIASQGDLSNIKSWQKRISDGWYTLLIPADSKPLMELKRNAEFMRGLGLKEFRVNIPELTVSATLPEGMNNMDYYILFPGSGSSKRQWPVSNFVKLAQKIYQTTGWVGVICGGKRDEIIGKSLVEEADIPIQDWVGRTFLRELVDIIGRAHLLIGNETSAVHIAAAVSTPAVCILGGGHYGRFIPYQVEGETAKPLPVAVTHEMDCFGCSWQCIYDVPYRDPVPCVKRISVEAVWKEVCMILEKKEFLIKDKRHFKVDLYNYDEQEDAQR